jgi:hypothetical protein
VEFKLDDEDKPHVPFARRLYILESYMHRSAREQDKYFIVCGHAVRLTAKKGRSGTPLSYTLRHANTIYARILSLHARVHCWYCACLVVLPCSATHELKILEL